MFNQHEQKMNDIMGHIHNAKTAADNQANRRAEIRLPEDSQGEEQAALADRVSRLVDRCQVREEVGSRAWRIPAEYGRPTAFNRGRHQAMEASVGRSGN